MITPQELIQAGAHIGHKKSKWNPKMAPFVFGVRNSLHVIDVVKTLEKLKLAVDFLAETVKSGGSILWVGARIQTKNVIPELARELNMPYVAGRWIGGLFTNFKIIKERLKYFRDLEEKFKTGGLTGYTKKEQIQFGRKLKKLEASMGGIKNLQSLPQAIFITDANAEVDAVLEAKKLGVKVVGLVDTSANPETVDYPIPINNDSLASLKLILDAIKTELTPLVNK
ncbi:MAG: 30S ribosomal protein S2 [Candidatus Sungbacteria bacterium]|uniref:Small ribosomal subunit protein uS2 n=1 Tax=Candidatus Sungiibacteriota bacterium TaxID=2750080 RepID=A0A932DS53_9BACT|nr:30S ribosomal protein S2 [Candidatus Sungbacteria bacterium]MBI2465690.1 30S ribosomal protein S2 [Candidatus Sungbacteria bacterium]